MPTLKGTAAGLKAWLSRNGKVQDGLDKSAWSASVQAGVLSRSVKGVADVSASPEKPKLDERD